MSLVDMWASLYAWDNFATNTSCSAAALVASPRAPSTAVAATMASFRDDNEVPAFSLTLSKVSTAFSAVATMSRLRMAALAMLFGYHVYQGGQVGGVLVPKHRRGHVEGYGQHGDQPAVAVPVGSTAWPAVSAGNSMQAASKSAHPSSVWPVRCR